MSFQQFRKEPSVRERELKNMPHPIWRGIGFMLMLVLPIFSFALADQLVNEYFIEKFLPYFPESFRISVPVYGNFVIDNFWGVVIITLIILLILSVFLMSITAIVFRISVGKDYNLYDAPRPLTKKRKKRKLYKSKF
jgi:hypothetical protein